MAMRFEQYSACIMIAAVSILKASVLNSTGVQA